MRCLPLLLAAVLLADDLEVLALRWMLHLVEEHILVAHGSSSTSSVDMLKYWVFHATEAKAAVENSSAVVFISLTESRVLVKLGEDLVECGNWCLRALLNRLPLLLLVLGSVEHVLASHPLVCRLAWVRLAKVGHIVRVLLRKTL